MSGSNRAWETNFPGRRELIQPGKKWSRKLLPAKSTLMGNPFPLPEKARFTAALANGRTLTLPPICKSVISRIKPYRTWNSSFDTLFTGKLYFREPMWGQGFKRG